MARVLNVEDINPNTSLFPKKAPTKMLPATADINKLLSDNSSSRHGNTADRYLTTVFE